MWLFEGHAILKSEALELRGNNRCPLWKPHRMELHRSSLDFVVESLDHSISVSLRLEPSCCLHQELDTSTHQSVGLTILSFWGGNFIFNMTALISSQHGNPLLHFYIKAHSAYFTLEAAQGRDCVLGIEQMGVLLEDSQGICDFEGWVTEEFSRVASAIKSRGQWHQCES